MDWVIVPKDPTPQMIAAMKATMPKMANERNWTAAEVKHLRRWRAALNAAPQPPDDVILSPHPYKF